MQIDGLPEVSLSVSDPLHDQRIQMGWSLANAAAVARVEEMMGQQVEMTVLQTLRIEVENHLERARQGFAFASVWSRQAESGQLKREIADLNRLFDQIHRAMQAYRGEIARAGITPEQMYSNRINDQSGNRWEPARAAMMRSLEELLLRPVNREILQQMEVRTNMLLTLLHQHCERMAADDLRLNKAVPLLKSCEQAVAAVTRLRSHWFEGAMRSLPGWAGAPARQRLDDAVSLQVERQGLLNRYGLYDRRDAMLQAERLAQSQQQLPKLQAQMSQLGGLKVTIDHALKAHLDQLREWALAANRSQSIDTGPIQMGRDR